jgi:hypothetical protein
MKHGVEIFEKSSVATTQESHCNIQKSTIATSKKPLQHGETMKNVVQKQQGDGLYSNPGPSPSSSPEEEEEFTILLATTVSLRSRGGG